MAAPLFVLIQEIKFHINIFAIPPLFERDERYHMDKTIIIKEGTEVSVLAPFGVIEGGYTIYSDDRLKSGSVIVKDPAGEILKVNPDRILYTNSASSVVVYDENGKAYAVCPDCKTPIPVSVKLGENGEINCNCPQHGDFKCHNNDKIKPQKAPKATNDISKPISKFVDFEKIAQLGELWVKDGVSFDHEKTEVQSCLVIFENHNRYITFNTYNGSYGKKNSRPAFEEMADGSKLGYEIKNISSLRNKYSSRGYRLYKSIK